MKYLYVTMFNDGLFSATQEIEHRVIRIPLTPEQEKMIEPRVTGSNGRTPLTETLRPISIQDEKAPAHE